MALVKCPECGGQVSDRAECCPKCACPMAGSRKRSADPVGISIRTTGRTSRTVQSPQRHRKWVAFLVVASLISSFFAPKFSLWLGVVFLTLCIGAFVPVAQGISRYLLRLDPAKKWQSSFRVAVYGFVGLILIMAGWSGSNSKAVREKDAASQVAADAAKKAADQRIVEQANAKVKSRVDEAESIWKNGNLALAEQTLDSASQIPNASDLSPVRESRVRIANAVVEKLMTEAKTALKSGDIGGAETKVKAALEMRQSDFLADVRKLADQIGNATDPIRLRAAMVELSDEDFQEFETNGKLPVQMISGFESLDQRTSKLAKAELGNVATERKNLMAEAKAKQKREKEAMIARAEANRRQKVSGKGSTGNSRVTVISSKLVDFVSPSNGEKMQMVIVTLKNTDSSPIRVVDAEITSYDSSGAIVGTNNYTIFAESDSSPGIAPGRTWTTRKGEGFILPGVGRRSKTVKVNITDVQENSGI